MLANFEKRYFENETKVWQGVYCDLQNIVHWHKEYELVYIRKGSAKIGLNQNNFIAQTGDLVICRGGDMHRINSMEKGTLCDIIIFDGDFLNPILHKRVLASPHIKTEQIAEKNLRVQSVINRISEELRQENIFAGEVIKAYITEFFVTCIRRLECIEASLGRKTHKQALVEAYQKLLEYIDLNYATASFEKSANFMGFTPQHFSKIFKEISGMTFTEYLNHVKIEKAVGYLHTTNMPVASIAEACGFNNIRSFNRIFRKITGFTPTGISPDFQLYLNLQPAGVGNGDFDATISYASID